MQSDSQKKPRLERRCCEASLSAYYQKTATEPDRIQRVISTATRSSFTSLFNTDFVRAKASSLLPRTSPSHPPILLQCRRTLSFDKKPYSASHSNSGLWTLIRRGQIVCEQPEGSVNSRSLPAGLVRRVKIIFVVRFWENEFGDRAATGDHVTGRPVASTLPRARCIRTLS